MLSVRDHVLKALINGGQMTGAEIYKKMKREDGVVLTEVSKNGRRHSTPSSIYHALKGLEEEGKVKRVKKPGQRASEYLLITEDGEVQTPAPSDYNGRVAKMEVGVKGNRLIFNIEIDGKAFQNMDFGMLSKLIGNVNP